MKTLIDCLLLTSLGLFIGVVVLGPFAWNLGGQHAQLEIEASACGDTTGIVSEGWEDFCAQRAAKATNL